MLLSRVVMFSVVGSVSFLALVSQKRRAQNERWCASISAWHVDVDSAGLLTLAIGVLRRRTFARDKKMMSNSRFRESGGRMI